VQYTTDSRIALPLKHSAFQMYQLFCTHWLVHFTFRAQLPRKVP
jgi:hypothetical protein